MDKVFGGVWGRSPQKLNGFCSSEIDLWWSETVFDWENIVYTILERTIAPIRH
jgi:hypothetical protein